MRVADEIIKSVGFVSRDTEPLRYAGTAFVVQVPCGENSGLLHVVTAKHVADVVGADFVIGFNGKDGEPLLSRMVECHGICTPPSQTLSTWQLFRSRRRGFVSMTLALYQLRSLSTRHELTNTISASAMRYSRSAYSPDTSAEQL